MPTPTSNANGHHPSSSDLRREVAGWLQVVIMFGAASAGFLVFGEERQRNRTQDTDITELRLAISDLVQVDLNRMEDIAALRERVAVIEARQRRELD